MYKGNECFPHNNNPFPVYTNCSETLSFDSPSSRRKPASELQSIEVLTVLLLILAHIPLCKLSNKELEDYEDHKIKISKSSDDLEFEPVVPVNNDKEKQIVLKNINCDDFSKYALNCTVEAALMYNSSRKAPPMPAKVYDWCRAIRHLTNCAIDWNSDCKDVTDSHFNEESIRGHMHVVSNICDDEWFLSKYDVLPNCIDGAKDIWESCYSIFKTLVDEQKNTTHEWTHFDTHFHMCCARAQFRRCTLDSLFDMPTICPYEQAVTLQKFSVIVSEGDVFQDCEHNMMYSNCPGGDPRPTSHSLPKYMSIDGVVNSGSINLSPYMDISILASCTGYFATMTVLVK